MSKTIPVFLDGDLPNMESHRDQRECGFSIYRGVLVQWDEDYDTRVLTLLDEMPAQHLENLLVVQEHEGIVAFLWKGKIPKEFENETSYDCECGDVWSVNSKVIRKYV